MILFHGTDIDSALDILNNGLDATKLRALQLNRPTQLGMGWYAACDAEVAWFFASLAPGNKGRGYTVIEIDIPENILQQLITSQFALRHTIANVPFGAQQYRFDVAAFVTLNAHAVFRPHTRQELSHD
ncbi:hypothetical protein [Candidatus Entotheonella palauensis]|uniref:PARP catalytic domain-containing protein n=1 Tax=Candidatus Entotheonella gemina TaxID=1429439 RepID=W4LM17_9BACT|nr:hypothetical protein [Candidatus Entotheonella palauensis]ETW98949.1 MAG: hypothetical protein ETSY2_41855 [Candidatus Entotheonella gemina]